MNLIDHLPGNTAYSDAIAQDEVAAEFWIRMNKDKSKSTTVARPSLSEWSPEVAALAEIRDYLAELISVTVATNGGKPSRVKPYARPEVAAERVRRRLSEERHNSLVSRVLPTNN